LEKALFLDCESLKIGVSPITNKDILCVSYHEKDSTVYFSIDKLKKKEHIRKKAGHIINRAKEAGVNILLFPEMAGIEALQEDYKKLYQEDWDGNFPQLIIFPSIWSNHTNTCMIAGMDGTQIGCQQKQHPYTFPMEDGETEAIEDLDPDKKILLFHIEGIGRMAVLICKDFLCRTYRRIILDSLKGTLLMVPSFSSGSFDFKQVMKECCQYDCGVIWCNCCSAMNLPNAKKENFQDIGYIQVSGKLTDSVGRISVEEKKPCKKIKCKMNCLFINEINLKSLL